MQIYGKSIASIESTDDDKFGPNGGFTAVLSTPSLDRDDEEVLKGEWIEPFEDRYTLDVDHGMTVAETIGSFHPYFDGDRLMMDAAFASTQKAQDTRTLIKEGHINHVSVAFKLHKSKKSAGDPYRELLNAGVVGVPANRDAVILASKAANALKDAFSDTTDGEVPEDVKEAVLEALGTPSADKSFLETFTKAVGGDASLVQAIHDAAGHLGAQCMGADTEPDVDEASGASDGANKTFTYRKSAFVIIKAALSGSVDDLQCRIQDAINAACDQNDYPWVRAVFLDDVNSGTVVYECGDETFARSFTDDGTTTTLGTDTRAVAMVTSVVDDRAAKSLDSGETDLETAENGENTPEIGPDSEITIDGHKLSFDEFKSVALVTSSLESSADDAAAAKAAAADEADEEVVDENRARRMEMLLFASESY